jgi:hypothetical protein
LEFFSLFLLGPRDDFAPSDPAFFRVEGGGGTSPLYAPLLLPLDVRDVRSNEDDDDDDDDEMMSLFFLCAALLYSRALVCFLSSKSRGLIEACIFFHFIPPFVSFLGVSN